MSEVWPLKLARTEGRSTGVAEIPVGDWLHPTALVVGGVAAGDLLYAASATQLAKLPAAAAGKILTMGAALPEWDDLPALYISQPYRVSSAAAMTALSAQRGDHAIRLDENKTYVLSSDNPTILSDWWEELSSGGAPVSSVNGLTGAVVLNYASVGALSATGTAVAATKLATARNINTVPFDGTADITVTAAAGTLTGTTLNATVVTSSLTSVGTLGSLAVSGTSALTTLTVSGTSALTGNLGVGGASAVQAGIDVTTSGTTGVSQYGIRVRATSSSGATTGTYGMLVTAATAAAAYTSASVFGVRIADMTLGAGSTVTTQYGLYVEAQTHGATNLAIFTAGTALVQFGGSLRVAGTIGMNAAPNTSIGIYGNPAVAITGAVTSYGLYMSPTVQSDVTTAMNVLYARAQTVASAFTISQTSGLHIADAALGAGSAITTQFGIQIDTLTAGASNIAIQTSGSASVIFGGSLRVGATLAFSNAPQTSIAIYVNSTLTLTGATTQHGVYGGPTFDSSATVAANAVAAKVTTAAAAFTCSAAAGVHVFDATLGAASAITAQYGVLIDAQTKGATNYSIRAIGTALSWFAGGLRMDQQSSVGGQAVDTTTVFRVQNTASLLTGGTQYGIVSRTVGNSSATGGVIGVQGRADTDAAAFTSAATYAFYAADPVKGAGSTITTAHGLYVEDITQGATNWAILTIGAAKSKFNGGIVLGATGITFSDATTITSATGVSGVDNINIAGVYFNVDSDNSDATNVDSFIWGRDRTATAGGTTLMVLNASGYLQLGTTVTTNVNAFDIVVKNAAALRGEIAATGDTKAIASLDSTNTVLLGGTGTTNVRVAAGIFLVNTAVTTSASSGDIVVAFQRGLRILNSASTTAYYAIDRTTIGLNQCIRIDPSALGPIAMGNPAYVDGAAAADVVLQSGGALWTSNAGGTANVCLVKNTGAHVQVGSVAGSSVLIGPTASLATTATDGFLYIDSCAGAPTGVPTAQGSLIPLVYDRTNNFLYVYNGGWKKTTVFA